MPKQGKEGLSNRGRMNARLQFIGSGVSLEKMGILCQPDLRARNCHSMKVPISGLCTVSSCVKICLLRVVFGTMQDHDPAQTIPMIPKPYHRSSVFYNKSVS